MRAPVSGKRRSVAFNLICLVLLCASGASAQAPPVFFGADYYAEDHSPEQVELDAAAMQRAGFNLVRMLDTNWAAIEPQDGKFQFAWLDRTLDVLSKHGIRAILGVPSYVPPYWMLKAHPEVRHIRVEDGSGRPLGRSFGVKLWPTLILVNAGVERARVVRPRTLAEIESLFAN